MRRIEPVVYRKGSSSKTATLLDARIINDDLQSSCTFYWNVRDEIEAPSGSLEPMMPGISLDEGNLTLGGSDYENWDGSNDYAYNFIATSLNLVLETEAEPIEE